MTTYQELYEMERKRADMCEGIIFELRRRISILESQLEERGNSAEWWQHRNAEEVAKVNELKRERRELRKALAAAKEAAA